MVGEQVPRCNDIPQAIEKFAGCQSPDPRVSEFARFIATRFGQRRSIIAPNFVLLSQMSLYELQNGIDALTGEPIENELAGLSDEEAEDLTRAVPDLARMAFGTEFGNAVESQFREMGVIPHEEAIPGKDFTENEILLEDIYTIDDAYEKIVLDARGRVLELDWQQYGIDSEDVSQLFEQFYPSALRQSPCLLPLTVLANKTWLERGLLLEILPTQKRHLSGEHWLGMTRERIPADMATFVRDYLFTKVAEVIAMDYNLDPREAIACLDDKTGTSSSITRAGIRMQTYMQEHPEIMR